MANNKSGSGTNFSYNVTFCEVPIPEEKRNEAKEKALTYVADLESVLAAFMTEGYKFSTRWDNQNRCYIASMTCDAPKHPNDKKCLVSRSNDWLEAIGLNVYKTIDLCKGGVWPERVKETNWG